MNWGLKMTERENDLDHLFAQARQTRPALPEDLAVRIETDAEAVRLQRLSTETKPARNGVFVLDIIGGWRGLGGLVAASATGVWIGFSAPAFLPDPASYLLSQDTTYLMADLNLDLDFAEETE